MIGLVAATERGRDLARHLEGAWPGARLFAGRPSVALPRAWRECRAVIAFMAVGAATRVAAPLLKDKRTDAGLVCVDDAGRFAVAVLGGHDGGANELARRAAETLGARPVVTTASDALGVPALEDLGADLGFAIDPQSDLAAVGAAIIGGISVTFTSDEQWPLPSLPPGVVRADRPEAPCLLVTDRVVDAPAPSVVYRPPSLVLGLGASRGVDAQDVLELVDDVLADAGLSRLSVTRVATVDAKADERGLHEAVQTRGWPVHYHASESLAELEVPNPSDIVASAVGTPSVAEAAVLAEGAELVVPKRRSANATVAVGRTRTRGRLFLVSTGPGGVDLLPRAARDALRRCELVVGLESYIDPVRPFLRPGTRVETSRIGDEIARTELAVGLATRGAAVALVSGGDVGVYAMASPALERCPADVDVVCVPGITAATAAAALLGSPLGHDHCAISLSDLLTPWDVIRRRIEAAAEGDFVVTFYNPRSRARDWQLDEARLLLLDHRKPSTPVGVVRAAYRPTQRATITTLGDLDTTTVDMSTTVIVGNSQTRVVAGRMVTPRGYA